MSQSGQAKIREQHFLLASHEHVLRLDIAVDELLLVGILQGGGHLLNIGDDLRQGQHTALRMVPL